LWINGTIWKHTLFPYPVGKIPIELFLSITLAIKHFCFSFRSNVNLYFPFNLSLYIVSTSILVMYIKDLYSRTYYINPCVYYKCNLAQNRGWKMSMIKFKNVQWKSPPEKEMNKKTFIYSYYLLKNICQQDPKTHFLLKPPKNIFGKM